MYFMKQAMFFGASHLIFENAKQLRKNMTEAEKLLWTYLKKDINGFKFRRQHPFIYSTLQFKQQFFVADFYCAKKKMIIELDGRVHDFQKDYDKNRDEVLAELGLKTIRIKNEQLQNDMAGVLQMITDALKG